MKEELVGLGGSTDGCVERADVVSRLLEARRLSENAMDEDEKVRQRRERAAAWAASKGSSASVVSSTETQVQECERIASDLAAQHKAKMSWVSGGLALGSKGSEDSGSSRYKRHKTEDDATIASKHAPEAPETPKRTTLNLTLHHSVSDKLVAQYFSQFGPLRKMSQAAEGRERTLIFEREEHAAAAARASFDVQLAIQSATLSETEPEAQQAVIDHPLGGGFAEWARSLTGGPAEHAAERGEKAGWSSREAGGVGGESGWKGREGVLPEAFGGHNSAGLRQAELERRLEEMDDDYRLPRDHQPHGYIDMRNCEMASMEEPIPASNKGHQMLLRMGWKGAGNGLGRAGAGICDPIPLTSKDALDLNSRVGLGKAEEESDMHAAATESRNALESEIQANEPEERRRRREEMVLKEEEIKVEVKEIISIFRCDICDKQYTTDEQYQEHLNSYDHHHKKRFDDYKREEKARQSGGSSAEERQRKEQKRMEKEMAARASALQAAVAARSQASHPAAPPAHTHTHSAAQPPPPLPEEAAAAAAPAAPVKFNLGFGAPKSKVGGAGRGVGKVGGGVVGASGKAAGGGLASGSRKPAAASIFAGDDNDE